MTNTNQTSQELIGKFLNREGYSDVDPIGKIIGIKGKTTLIVQNVEASENKVKMEFIPGGFSAICLNQWQQEYDFYTTDKIFELRLSKKLLKTVRIEDNPRKFYDYNF